MIINLRIQNVALIHEAEINFGNGLNVLTGETGAGKSILVDSINFLLGARPGRDFIRTGAESAFIEGLLEINDIVVLQTISGMGVDFSGENQMVIQRTAHINGKSVCRANGRVITVGMLKEISSLLVDIHGQHEHQSLLNTNKQLQLLDLFCGEELNGLKNNLENLLQQYRENGKALKEMTGTGSQREAQLDMWKFQKDEIEKAKPNMDEEENLTARRTRLGSLEKLYRSASNALAFLNGSENQAAASDQVARALSLLTEIGKLDPMKQSMADSLGEAATLLSDVISELNLYMDELDADPLELERIEARLDVIYRLKRKYGPSLSDVLAHYERVTREIDNSENSELKIKRLTKIRRELTGEITKICSQITKIRQDCAGIIGEQITAVLKDLGMPHARFEINIEQKTAFGPEGNDKAEFMISPNLGEALKPLHRIASGGEMSRVMLAVKTVLADADKIETLIFDEIDAGVSGRTAQQVAEKLMAIGRRRQIFCITHLPQIAAMADSHFLIEKKTEGEKTITSVYAQDKNGMIKDLARLIGGAKITAATQKAAEEMKQQANQMKSG